MTNSFFVTILIVFVLVIVVVIIKENIKRKRDELYNEIIDEIGLNPTDVSVEDDSHIDVSSRSAWNNYDDTKFFGVVDSMDIQYGMSTPDEKIRRALAYLEKKWIVSDKISKFMSAESKKYESRSEYEWVKTKLSAAEVNARTYNICVTYTTPAGRDSYEKRIRVSKNRLKYLLDNPETYMSTRAYRQQLSMQLKKSRSNI